MAESDVVPENSAAEISSESDVTGIHRLERLNSTDDPELEFDDSGLELAAKEGNLYGETYFNSSSWRQELAKNSSEGSAFRSGSITPDGLIDEDFEKELGTPDEEDERDDEFKDVSQYGIVEVAGDDMYGRKVIIFSSCRLPSNKILDHQRLFLYMRHTLDQYVENDYVIVYFHFGLNRGNKPKLSWLIQIYRELDRKYKKNLKALYLVHPTNFIKIIWNIFRPIIRSVKFGKKVMYVNYLHELKQYLHFDQLVVPQPVLEHDAKVLSSNKPSYPYTGQILSDGIFPPTQQFGVSLQFIKQNSGNVMPTAVERSVEFMRKNALDVEGLFRRSPNFKILKEVQEKINNGDAVDFEELRDVHIPAVILKTFLRKLSEPILTFDLYEPIMRLHNLEEDRVLVEMRRMLVEELPEDNYEILKYIIQFLTEVAAHSEKNMMTTQNLGIVFGPNLLWPKGQASLSSMSYLHTFTDVLISNYSDLFNR